jgi:F-type H+-transporting ATPase subunit b
MRKMLRRVLLGASLLGPLGLCSNNALADVATAQEHEAQSPETLSREREAIEETSGEGRRDEGIVNWWSWDYGPSAAEPAHRGWPPPFGWAVVNFIIFAGILSRLLWRPLRSGWVARHDQIKGELTEARRLREEAERQLAEYGKKVANADREVDELLAMLRKEADAERSRLVAAAEAEAARLKADAERQIKVEIERARAELRHQAVTAAVAAAEEILRKNVNADDQRRLAERYLGELDHLAQPKPPSGGAA